MQYEIQAGDYRATVTELGAGLRELLFREQPVIAGYRPTSFPWRGRASCSRHGRTGSAPAWYVFDGAELQLALTEPAHANAIHGLSRWMAWTAVSHDTGSVLLRSAPHGQQGYPFCRRSTPDTASQAPGCMLPSPRVTAAATRLPTAPARTRT